MEKSFACIFKTSSKSNTRIAAAIPEHGENGVVVSIESCIKTNV